MTDRRPEPARLEPDAVRALAAEHCRDCGWYHGFWPLLRRLGFGTAPEDHEEFYRAAVAAAGAPIGRVLVCGSADGSMPLLIGRILREFGHRPELTILDRCRTPLLVSERECTSAGLAVETVCADALQADPGSFDLVVAHSFLGYFDEPGRERLLRLWRSWLRPGGRALTVNRVRPGATGTVAFTEAEARAFCSRVTTAAGQDASVTRMTAGEVRRAAALYARRFRIRPVASAEGVLAMARAAGFSATASHLGVLSLSAPSGPTTRGAGDYWGVTLER